MIDTVQWHKHGHRQVLTALTARGFGSCSLQPVAGAAVYPCVMNHTRINCCCDDVWHRLWGCCVWRLRQLEPGVACVDDITRLLYCWMCRGQVTSSSTPRCRGHCGNIVRACLAVHSDVNSAWNNYLCQSFLRLNVCLSESVRRVSRLVLCCCGFAKLRSCNCWKNDSYITCYCTCLLRTISYY